MEATCSSETLVDFKQTTPRYISEDGIFHNHRCKNLKSYTCLNRPYNFLLPRTAAETRGKTDVGIHIKTSLNMFDLNET
jgi:hypothetical protein